MHHRSFIFAVISFALLLGACSNPDTPGGDEFSEQALPDQAIVVLEASFAPGGHEANRAEAARVARDLGLSPVRTYGTALFGFAAVVPSQRLAGLERDPRVAYVEPDKVVTTFHHQCGHEGGPPGGSGPACEPGDVDGTVTDSETGSAIEGATVVLENTDYSATTDSNGDYLIESVEAGSYTATASADGYQSQSEDITVDGDVTVDFALDPESDDDGGGDGSNQTLPWGVERIGAPTTNTGVGIDVYVIDTGIDADHSDLQGNLGNGYAAVSCRGGGCLNEWDDDNGHGTHVAGTVAAIDNDVDVIGVVPDATLHAVKVLANNGSGNLSDVIAGIDWVAAETEAKQTATVANLSLGASGSKDGTCEDGGFTGSDSFHEAVCNAANVGVVFAVAAGNDGADAENAVPAAYDDAVITASATSEADDWPSWSNWGDDNAPWASVASAPVALAAPGVDVLSTRAGGGTTTMSGTSMASPHLAGSAAAHLDANTETDDYSAFTGTRTALLDGAESTDTFSNSSGNPHDEPFVSAP